MKTSSLILVAFNIVLLLFAGASYQIYTSFSEIGAQIQKTSGTTQRVLDKNFELSQAIKDVKFDVVQVQQWLTDISATRGLDGLNDGKIKADEFAKLFATDSAHAKDLAQDLGMTDVVTTIDSIQENFPDYLAVGNQMADAYIASGAEGGNKMMGQFDAAAQKVADDMDVLTRIVEKSTQDSKHEVVTALKDTQNGAKETLTMLIMVMGVIFCMAAMASAAVFIIIKRRAKMMEQLANVFEGSVHKLSAQLGQQATHLLSKADTMRVSMEMLNSKTEETSAASNQAAGNIQFVASATEELSSSVAEIRQQIEKSNDVIEESNSIMVRAEAASSALDGAVQSISEVLGIIQGLAGQINMLALNATIESARAGEAGKGFAVVAGEVKNLANETATATTRIADKIGEVKGCSESVLDVIATLKDSMESVKNYAQSIAGAVNQQAAATREIAERMVSVSDHTRSIDENLKHVASISEENNAVSHTVLETAQTLNTQSTQLDGDVVVFLKDVRRMA